MTEDKMVGWHHQLDGHESEQAVGVGDGQGSLVRCSPWGHKELDMTDWTELTEVLNNVNHAVIHCHVYLCLCLYSICHWQSIPRNLMARLEITRILDKYHQVASRNNVQIYMYTSNVFVFTYLTIGGICLF